MSKKQYLWRVKVRGTWLWCHASSDGEAIRILSEQTGEPLEEYCLEWQEPKNLDGSPITDAEYNALWGIN